MKPFDSIPASLLRQHLFCPRIPWLQRKMGLQPATPLWVKQGEDYHAKQQELFKRRNLSRFGLEQAIWHFELSLWHNDLSFHGKPDALLELDEEVIPLEFKMTGSKPLPSQIVQLTAYGLLAEKSMGKICKRGFLLYEERGKTHEIIFDELRKQKVFEVAMRILDNESRPLLPDSSAGEHQCGQCEYLNYCNDRE